MTRGWLRIVAALFLTFIVGSNVGAHNPAVQSQVERWAAHPRPILDLDFTQTFDSRITFTRASTAPCFNQLGILTTFASGVERLPCYTYDGTNWNNRGFLIEEARTNVALQSEALGTTWTNPGGNTTITDNAGVAVDGATTAEDVLHGDSAETVQQTITATDNVTYTICANVKQGSTGSHDFVKIAWLDESDGANGFEAWYDISAGSVGTAQADGTGSYTSGSATITDLSGGWYRVCANGQIVSGQTDARFEIINTTADAVDTAEATNSVFWWGLQAERADFSSSYISTTTAAVTRAADVSTMSSLPAGFVDGGDNTVYIKASFPAGSVDSTSLRRLFVLSDNSASPRFEITARPGTPQAQGVIAVDSGNAGLVSDSGTWTVNVERQIIFSWATNNATMAIDGAIIGTDIAVDIPSGMIQIDIGKNQSSFNWINGYVSRITLWNRRLSNGRLQDKTAFLDLFGGTMYAANDNEWPLLEAVGW